MTFFYEIGAAVLLIILTLWLQCSDLAALILWVRRAVASDLHKLGLFRSAALVVRLSAGIIALHGLLILLWAGCYRVGICFLLLGLQLYHRRLWRLSASASLADVGAAGGHYRRVDVRSICQPTVCDSHSARRPRSAILALVSRISPTKNAI